MMKLNLLEETRFENFRFPYLKILKLHPLPLLIVSLTSLKKQSENQPAVLGLATGVTPIAVYAELVRLHKQEGLSFHNVITFNLDEYYPMQPNAAQSYVTFMKENLFDHINIEKAISIFLTAPLLWKAFPLSV